MFCLVYQLGIPYEFLDVFIANKTGTAANLVDDAFLFLYPCFAINSRDCFFKAGKTVYVEQRNVLYTSAFQLVQYAHPVFGRFIECIPLLVTLRLTILPDSFQRGKKFHKIQKALFTITE